MPEGLGYQVEAVEGSRSREVLFPHGKNGLERTSQSKNELLSFSKQNKIKFLMPSRSHLFLLGDTPTLNVKHTQEISPKFDRGACFAGIPVVVVTFLELHHTLADAGPFISHRASGRTSKIPCSTVLPID